MAKSKKRRRQPARGPASLGLGETSVAQAQDSIGRNALLLQDMHRAEIRAATAERELAEIRRKLVSLLSADQIEAARVCGVTAEFYALECIELHQQTFFPHLPARLRPLWVLKTPGGQTL